MFHRLLFLCWIVLEICIFASFLTADILLGTPEGLYSRGVKYTAILLAAAAAQFIGDRGYGTRDRLLLQTALLLTGIADLLIGILGLFKPGIAVFLVVQATYVMRHGRGFQIDRHTLIPAACLYIPTSLLLFLTRANLVEAGFLIPATVYGFTAATSLIVALQSRARGTYDAAGRKLVPLGMLLFFACDVNVGLYHAGIGGNSTGILVWVFYLPAQVVLICSGMRADFLRTLLPMNHGDTGRNNQQ